MRECKTIFDVIDGTTRRREPFHSRCLGWFLEEDAAFQQRFLSRCLPQKFVERHGLQGQVIHIDVFTEDTLCHESRSRIDLLLKNETFLIGVEVKTTDSSTTANQLLNYWDLLHARHDRGEREIFMVYLTPFNEHNLPGDVSPDSCHAVTEYRKFEAIPGCRGTHLNWLQVAELYEPEAASKNVGPIYRQHRQYLEKVICDPAKFSRLKRNRALAEFLGEETVQQFFDVCDQEDLPYEETNSAFVFDLDALGARAEALVAALDVLLCSPHVNQHAKKRNKLETTKRREYEEGTHGAFFAKLFQIVDSAAYAWLEGADRVGVRVAHEAYGSGVSICTISPAQVQILKKRRARPARRSG